MPSKSLMLFEGIFNYSRFIVTDQYYILNNFLSIKLMLDSFFYE